jgi:hypothetical protein
MTRKNNFYIVCQTPPTQCKNPYNQTLIPRKLESLDDSIQVSNCLVTITLNKDGTYSVGPNLRNVDEVKLRKHVS